RAGRRLPRARRARAVSGARSRSDCGPPTATLCPALPRCRRRRRAAHLLGPRPRVRRGPPRRRDRHLRPAAPGPGGRAPADRHLADRSTRAAEPAARRGRRTRGPRREAGGGTGHGGWATARRTRRVLGRCRPRRERARGDRWLARARRWACALGLLCPRTAGSGVAGLTVPLPDLEGL